VAAVVVLGTFEHDVLEEMGEAGAALFFVFRPYVVPNVNRHQRDGVVFMQEYV
jgi:hypothetical protein